MCGVRGLYSARKRRIWAMSASVRCVCGPAPGRPPHSGGGRLFGFVLVLNVDNVDVDCGDDDDDDDTDADAERLRRNGDDGAVVRECGEGAEGGGRCMNVNPGSISLMIAFVDVVRGSRGRGRGFCAGRDAYARTPLLTTKGELRIVLMLVSFFGHRYLSESEARERPCPI